jgi:peptidoglycan/xylan/chitin deacetylase (PgdA/CDA1 family)
LIRDFKIIFYLLARCLGLFSIAAWLTRKKLRILCYHGFSVTDEHEWFPGVFMTHRLMRERFLHIKRKGYPVLSLEDALRRLSAGNLPKKAVVLTFDDGFSSTLKEGVPLLKEFSFPATLYVTSYYVSHSHPIFRLVVQYLFWKTRKEYLDLGVLEIGMSAKVGLHGVEKNKVMMDLMERGEKSLDNVARDAFLRRLGQALEVDVDAIFSDRRFHLLTPEEIRSCIQGGFDIQLHTHRHRFPSEPSQLRDEILRNKEVLEPLTGKKLSHLCYPSGVFDPTLWPELTSLGVMSGTTCEQGLNSAATPKLGLQRQLDSENVTQVEFEAELSGFVEMMRFFFPRRTRLKTEEQSA